MALQRFQHTGAAPPTSLASGMSAVTFTFTAAAGTGYPDGSVGPFIIKIDAGTSSEEKVLCSARSGSTFTVATSGRGYDNTTATSHVTGAAVEHCLAAAEVDDMSDHVYTTGRDDHTQYVRTDGSRTITGGLLVNNTVTSNQGFIAQTNHGYQGGMYQATLTGQFSRYVGGMNGGPPTSGTYLAGDTVTDLKYGVVWVCTTAGTPGSWANVGGGLVKATLSRAAAYTQAPTGFTILPYDTAVIDPSSLTTTGASAGFTCPVAGRYYATGRTSFTAVSGDRYIIAVFKNGVEAYRGDDIIAPGSNRVYTNFDCFVDCAATDVLTVQFDSITATNVGFDVGTNLFFANFGLV